MVNHYKSLASSLLKTKDFPRICFYCGEPATDKEHVFPKVYYGENTPKVWSCSECNKLAGKEVFCTIEDKFVFIKKKIEKKYKYVFEYPDWDEDEIKELKGSLKQSVQKSILLKDWVKKRLVWSFQPEVLLVMKYIMAKLDSVTTPELPIEFISQMEKFLDLEE